MKHKICQSSLLFRDQRGICESVTELPENINSNHALQLGIVPLNSTTQFPDDVSLQSSSYHPYFDWIFVRHCSPLPFALLSSQVSGNRNGITFSHVELPKLSHLKKVIYYIQLNGKRKT